MASETSSRNPLKSFFGALTDGDVSRLLKENIRAQPKLYAVAVLAMVLVAATTAMTAWIMQRIVDSMTTEAGRSQVYVVALMVLAIFFVKGWATYIQMVVLTRAGNRIVATQQVRLFDKLLKQGVAFFNLTESSNMLMRVTQSAQAARMVIDQIVTAYVRDLLTLVGLVAVMFYQNAFLSLVALVFGPLALLGVRVLLKKVRSIAEQELASLGEIIKVIQETSTGIRVIKAFALEERMAERMRGAVRQVEKRSNAIARLQSITSPLMDSLSGLAIASVVVLSAVNLFGSGTTTPGELMSFVTALLMAYEPAKRLSRVRVVIETGMVGVRMMFKLLDRPDVLTEHPEAADIPPGRGEVVFEGVSFNYRAAKPVLSALSTTFEAGKTTALVGPSGGGKSTILNLIMRLYDPVKGRVLVDGHDLSRATFRSLRERMSYVGQDTFLFSTTVMENIRAGRPGATDDDVTEAAKAAHADEFIRAMPKGYATQVGENGAFLSGGQRQRIAIARAILRDAEILLLDEATSALDSESEGLVKESLARLTEGVTTIVIAHRLSTVLNADKICVIENGRIIEEGSAQELLRSGGTFKRLFDQQFGNAEELRDA